MLLQCPECKGKLVYDIASEGMVCSSCGKLFHRDDLRGVKREVLKQRKLDELLLEVSGAESLIPAEDRGIAVTVYTCPVCGREIIGDPGLDLTGCSHCGAGKKLEPCDTAMHRPDMIIPFKITREECLRRYNHFTKKQIYRPFQAMGDGGFRPVYMPFHSYDFKREGRYLFEGKTREAGEGTTIVTWYKVHGRMRGHFEDVSVPATEDMNNRVAEEILPFRYDEAVPFEESYLSGFYVSPENKDPEVTKRAMKKAEVELVIAQAKKDFADIGLNVNKARKQLLGEEKAGTVSSEEMHLYPVWYMPFKTGDRVSYAMVNGQTGEVAGDVPVSRRKLFSWVALTAIPLVFLFRLLCTATPSYLYFAITLASMILSWITLAEVRDLYRKSVGFVMTTTPQKIIEGVSWVVAGAGLMTFFTYGPLESFPLLFWGSESALSKVRLINCILLAVLTAYRFAELDYRYSAIVNRDDTVPAAILLVTAAVSTILFCFDFDSLWGFIPAPILALGTAFAVKYQVAVHNRLESERITPRAEGREDG